MAKPLLEIGDLFVRYTIALDAWQHRSVVGFFIRTVGSFLVPKLDHAKLLADEINTSVIGKNCRELLIARAIDLDVNVFLPFSEDSVAYGTADDKRGHPPGVSSQSRHQRSWDRYVQATAIYLLHDPLPLERYIGAS